MRVIGTAGHVDHGKSTLIAALTGINPDRLKEEQEREMTIDLGFAWLTLPSGEEVGIVDVPGHIDFIENMLAGVGGIDAALLVIAADEGVMPQTREHLAILDLLEIKQGLVVLTKIDLVEDPAWLDLVEADIRRLLLGTVLQNAPLVRVSSRSRAGFPELLQSLDRLWQGSAARLDLGRPRLPIDRVFSIPGFGTIVTGTLSDGQLSTGDEIEILPSGLHGRIRGLQTHKKKEEIAIPGSRTAVNISGVDVDQVRRGEVVVHPGQYHPTRRVDVHFRLLADASTPLHHHTEAKFFSGTAEVLVDVRLLGAELLNPGESGWLQLELRDPLVAVRGDRFILRRPSPGETLGGGTVVDPQPKGRHKRFDADLLQGLASLAQGTPADILVQASLALGPALARDVILRSRLDPSVAEIALQELLDSGQLIRLENMLIANPQWSLLRGALLAAVTAYHQAFPLKHGIPREELKSRLKLPPQVFTLVCHRLAAEGFLIESPRWISMPDHRVRFSPFQQVKVDQLIAKFRASPLAPPSVKECQAEVGEAVYAALLELGDLVEVSDEVAFRTQDFDTILAQITEMIQARGRVTLAEVRDLLKTSRRFTQAILEHLDATGVTVRDGDFRRLSGGSDPELPSPAANG